MYSPKIREDLIPNLYRIAKEQSMPMTRLVSDVLESYISHYKSNGNGSVESCNDLELTVQEVLKVN